jgi:NitT/TauT family transport system ATP-binding protein
MIELKEVDVFYGDEKALDHVSLHIPPKSTCAVIGPSGCCKTTMLYALAGLVKPSSGTINIENRKIDGIRKSTGLILQNYGLLPWKTVWENAAFPLKSRGLGKIEIESRVTEILVKLGIIDCRNKYPDELSGGQRQRVAIGRTLALEPDLLLMDEASSALDAITKENLQDLVLDIYRERNLTMVVVTHNIDEALFLGQKIYVMNKGRIVSTVANPCFGDRDHRNLLGFHETYLEVRKMLYA